MDDTMIERIGTLSIVFPSLRMKQEAAHCKYCDFMILMNFIE